MLPFRLHLSRNLQGGRTIQSDRRSGRAAAGTVSAETVAKKMAETPEAETLSSETAGGNQSTQFLKR